MLWIYWRDTESKKSIRIYIYRKKKLEGESVVNFTSWTTSYTISIIQLHMCLDVSWFPLTQQCHGCGMSFSNPFDWKTMTRNVHSNPHFQKTTRLTTSYIYILLLYMIYHVHWHVTTPYISWDKCLNFFQKLCKVCIVSESVSPCMARCLKKVCQGGD